MPPDEYTCEDCQNEFFSEDGCPYKDDPVIYLCEACCDLRVQESTEFEISA
jgi:hypothetical protein